MKLAAILLVAAGLASAGAASASVINTDLDYLKASRCKGLAAGLGETTPGLDATLKAESRSRSDVVVNRAKDETDRAKRQAEDANMKDRLTAELNGPCTAYLTPTGAPANANAKVGPR
jgi:hypothetical protein